MTTHYCSGPKHKHPGVAPSGILDYLYGCWWKCRVCGAWKFIKV